MRMMSKKSGELAGELVPQPHGGAIRRGGKPGHRPGPGRPPSEIRERVRGSFAERVAILESIIDDPSALNSDRIRALDLLGKYGIGAVQELSTDDVRHRLERTLEVIRERTPQVLADTLIGELQLVWTR